MFILFVFIRLCAVDLARDVVSYYMDSIEVITELVNGNTIVTPV